MALKPADVLDSNQCFQANRQKEGAVQGLLWLIMHYYVKSVHQGAVCSSLSSIYNMHMQLAVAS